MLMTFVNVYSEMVSVIIQVLKMFPDDKQVWYFYCISQIGVQAVRRSPEYHINDDIAWYDITSSA